MAKMDATIRVRADTREGVNRLDDLQRAADRSKRTIEQLNKELQQRQAGGLPGGDLQTRIGQEVAHLGRVASMWAIERANQVKNELAATRLSLDQQAAQQQKAAQASGKMHTMALLMDQKMYVDAEMKKIKAVEVRTREELKLANAATKEKLAIEKRFQDESARYWLARMKYEQQVMAAGGAAGGARGGLDVHGRWNPGAYKVPAFGSMSDRFTAMFTVGNVMADITGDKSGAREASLAASGFMLGSPLFASLNAGAVAVGAYFRVVRENAQEARKAMMDFSSALVNVSTRWTEMARNLVTTTGFGETLRSELSSIQKEVEKASDSLREQSLGKGALNDTATMIEGWFKGGDQNTGVERTKKMIEMQKNFYMEMYKLIEANEAEQAVKKTAEQRRAYLLELNRIASGGMESDVARERANRQFGNDIRYVQLEQKHREQMAQAQLAVAIAEKSLANLQKQINTMTLKGPGTGESIYDAIVGGSTEMTDYLALAAKQQMARRNLERAKSAIPELQKQQAAELEFEPRRARLVELVEEIKLRRQLDKEMEGSVSAGLFGPGAGASRSLQVGGIEDLKTDIADGVRSLAELLAEVRKIAPVFASN